MRTRRERRRAMALGVFLLALPLAWAPAAMGQQAGEPAAIEEIVVTAQKREQNLQDAALSVSALSAGAIERRGLAEMSDYLNTIPGVTMVDRGSSRRSIAVRGLAIDPTFEAGSQSTVGVYFGDVPLSNLNFGPNGDRGGNADPRLVDMERIEVLRGPQGTLYGAGSLAGTVRYIPRDPVPGELSGRVAAEVSATDRAGDGNSMFQGAINFPLAGESLTFRGTAYHFAEAGYIDDIGRNDPALLAVAELNGVPEQASVDHDVGGSDVVGSRASLLWLPTERFSAQFSYLYERLRQEGLTEVQSDLPGKYQQSRLDVDGRVTGNLFAPGGRGNDDELNVANLVLEYDAGPVLLYSSTSYGKIESTATFNGRGILEGFNQFPLPWQQDFNTAGIMEEFRVTTQLDGPLQAIVGLYYEDLDRDFEQNVYYGADADAYAAVVEPIFGPNAAFPKFFGDVHDIDFEQKAVFGELTYRITGSLEATVGARRFKYDTRQLITDAHFPFLGLPPTDDTPRFAVDEDNNFKANLSFEPNDDTLIYVQWAEGFRQAAPTSTLGEATIALCDVDSDGIIDGTTIPVGDVGTLSSDTSDNYELGIKLSRLLDGRLQLNAAVYRVRWSGLPLTIRPPCGAFFQLNSGDARSQGVEVEANLLLGNVLLNVNASYVDAELTEDFAAVGGEDGDRLPGSADVSVTAGATYEFELLGRPAYAAGDVNYVGGFYNNVQEQGMEIGDYVMANLRAGVTLERMEVEVFAKNVTNEDALTWLETAGNSADNRGARLRPRTVGASIRYVF